MQVQSIEA